MIILREKSYSTKLGKTLYKLEKIKDIFHTKTGDKIYKNISNRAIKLSNYGKEIINPDRVEINKGRFLVNTDYKIPSQKRRALLKQNSIRNRGNVIKTRVENIAINPGDSVNKAIKTTIENPISTSAQIAGKVTMITDPSGLGAIPIGAGGIGVEQLAKKNYPKYKATTKNLSKKYEKNIGRYVEAGTNSGINFLKSIS